MSLQKRIEPGEDAQTSGDDFELQLLVLRLIHLLSSGQTLAKAPEALPARAH